MEFIFKDPTFIKRETSSKQEKLFEINPSKLEKAIGGTQFEVTLINEMKTRNIAIECAKWIEQKVKFKTNNTKQLFNNSYFNVLADEEEIRAKNIKKEIERLTKLKKQEKQTNKRSGKRVEMNISPYEMYKKSGSMETFLVDELNFLKEAIKIFYKIHWIPTDVEIDKDKQKKMQKN